MEAKKYNFASGFYIYKREFQNGGHILNVSGDYAQFTAWLKTICDESGRFRMVIAEKREQVEKKPSHTAYEDTWKPKPRTQDDYDQRPQEERQQAARTTTGTGAAVDDDGSDGMPF